MRRSTVTALTPYGYCLLEAIDGQQALEAANQYPGDIHLLITDVSMPRMRGHELARRIKQHRPNIRILIVSGLHEEEFPPEAIYHSDALVKPVVPEVLVDKVKQLLVAA